MRGNVGWVKDLKCSLDEVGCENENIQDLERLSAGELGDAE